MVSQRQLPSERKYEVSLSGDEIYEVVNSLNAEAGHFAALVQKATQPGFRQTDSTKQIWTDHAVRLRTLARRILRSRKLPNGGGRASRLTPPTEEKKHQEGIF